MSVSVVVPVFNRGSRVQKTLDSIVGQSVAPLEILVVDDGSSDGSAEWIENHYGEAVRVLRQANGGVARARNFGLKEARGEYIAFCDHDDEWLPHKLDRQLKVARAHPEAALVGCNWRDVDEEGNEWSDPIWDALYKNWLPARGWVYDWVCASPCPIISMTLPLLHAEKLRSVGGLDPRCVPCDDWDLYLRLAHRFPFEWVEETLALYVHHSNQQSGDITPLHEAMKRVLDKQRSAIWSHRRSVGFWWSFSRFLASSPSYYRAKTGLESGNRGSVVRELARVGVRHPFALSSKQWLYLALRLARGQFGPY